MIAVVEKYLIQQRTATGIETIAELPVLENGKVDINWLPVVGSMGSAVIERGSNANGEYVKFADGTMICKTGWYYLGNELGVLKTVTFPAAFSQKPKVIPVIDMYNENINTTLASCFIYCAKRNTVTTTSCTISVVSVGVSLSNGDTQMLVVGRWK